LDDDRSGEVSRDGELPPTLSYLNVVIVQVTVSTNGSMAVNILGRRETASMLLIKALGGS
jgi:hypothetical protein